MYITRNYSKTTSIVIYTLLALASSIVLSFSLSSFASAAPKVSSEPIDFNLVSLSPASGSWGTKVTIATDATNLGNKRLKSYKINVNSSKTPTVATSKDGGKTYTFVLETFCPENGPCPAIWPVSGDIDISLRDSYGTSSNALIFTLAN
jgi:hypothetical protein